jgi:hypothetical protein
LVGDVVDATTPGAAHTTASMAPPAPPRADAPITLAGRLTPAAPLPELTELALALETATRALQSGRPDQVLAALDRVWTDQHTVESPWYLRTAALELLGRPADAEQMIRDAIARLPRSAAMLYMLGVHMAQQGQPQAARIASDHALALHPTEPLLWVQRAALALRAGDAAQVDAIVQRLMASDPQVPAREWIRVLAQLGAARVPRSTPLSTPVTPPPASPQTPQRTPTPAHTPALPAARLPTPASTAIVRQLLARTDRTDEPAALTTRTGTPVTQRSVRHGTPATPQRAIGSGTPARGVPAITEQAAQTEPASTPLDAALRYGLTLLPSPTTSARAAQTVPSPDDAAVRYGRGRTPTPPVTGVIPPQSAAAVRPGGVLPLVLALALVLAIIAPPLRIVACLIGGGALIALAVRTAP